MIAGCGWWHGPVWLLPSPATRQASAVRDTPSGSACGAASLGTPAGQRCLRSAVGRPRVRDQLLGYGGTSSPSPPAPPCAVMTRSSPRHCRQTARQRTRSGPGARPVWIWRATLLRTTPSPALLATHVYRGDHGAGCVPRSSNGGGNWRSWDEGGAAAASRRYAGAADGN